MSLKPYFLICTIVLLQSCGKDNHTRKYRLPKSEIPTKIQSEHIPKSGINWEKPDMWMPSSGSSMRLVSFEVPYSGLAGDLSVIQLAGTGGGLKPNINRWRRQLNLEPQSLPEIEKDVIEKKGTLGKYKMIRIINFQNNLAFLVAIIPVENQTLFVKLSADPPGIQEAESDFIFFCSSIHIVH
jgi:hypothetical protein